MVQLGYSYKGRPLAPYGKKSRKGPSPSGKLFRIFLLCLVVFVILFFAGWEITGYIKSLFKNTAETAENIVVETRELVSPNKNTANVSAKTDAKRFLDKASELYRNKQYMESRKQVLFALAFFSDNDPLFLRAEQLLGRSSMSLYYGLENSGKLIVHKVKRGETLSKIANEYGSSVESIQKTNAMQQTSALNIGQTLKVYKGNWKIELKPSRGKLFLYDDDVLFKIYPITVGSDHDGHGGKFKIWAKLKYPSWSREGKTFAPGSADNILGSRWMELRPENSQDKTLSKGIHGTNNPAAIGKGNAGTKPGFFSMKNEDIDELFSMVPPGTPVEVFSQ